MDYKVLARRYRPARFSDVVGQEHVVRTLVNAIKAGRIAHAYLFAGSRGVGKTSTARIFAKALNCPNKTDYEPCCECDVCRAISEGEDMDVIEMDGASNRGIDDIRNLRENVAFRPARSPYKIYIIDEVHMLTREAFNALLKTLEEPPDYVKFVFCTTEPEKIPATILSRCQRFDFHRLSLKDITGQLERIARREGFEVDNEALAAIARHARGGLRDSISLLEQLLSFTAERVTLADVKLVVGAVSPERLKELVGACARGDAGTAVKVLNEVLDSGRDSLEMLEQLTAFLRDCLVAREAPGSPELLEGWITPEDVFEGELKGLSVTSLLLMLNYLYWARPFLKEDSSGRIPLEIAVVRMAHAAEIQDIPALLKALGRTGTAVLKAERSGELPRIDARETAPLPKKTAPERVEPTAAATPPKAKDEPKRAEAPRGEERSPEAGRERRLAAGGKSWYSSAGGGKADPLGVPDVDRLKKEPVVGKVLELFPGAAIEDARKTKENDTTRG